MGQAQSQSQSQSAGGPRRQERTSRWGPLRSSRTPADTSQPDRRHRTTRPRPQSFMSSLSRLLPDAQDAGSSSASSGPVRRRSRLLRSRASLLTPSLFHRPSTDAQSSLARTLSHSLPEMTEISRPAPRRSEADDDPVFLPLQVPDFGLDFDQTMGGLTARMETEPETQAAPREWPSRPAMSRSSSNLSDRISTLRPDRSLRHLPSTLRRRRSISRRHGDQAAMLSRLLSVAAAATAATLMGGDQRAVSQARNVASDGEDGTFDGFLQSLQNGSIASALRQSNTEADHDSEAAGGGAPPLNFFRMFRFGSPTDGGTRDGSTQAASNRRNSSTEDSGDARMVPIIIVGIRSITPGSGAAQDDNGVPPFLDALSSFPSPLTHTGDIAIDGMLRQPQNGTRFSHRRRASMGGFGFPSNYDSQRHHRPPDRPRPWSTVSDSPAGPRPPPSTPASTGLSAFSSGTTTPTHAQTPSSPSNLSAAPSRRNSFIHRTGSMGLEPTVEEPQTPPRSTRQRRLSESDFTRYGSGSSRRNGMVEPDESPSDGSRSWIIYVLGGSYPENHPILTTPSLFTDSPTYEDMLLLSALLGPVKPPVATEADVAAAPGLFVIHTTEAGTLQACEVDGDEIIALTSEQQCLVCLSDFETDEEARQLVKCGHLFHRDCIDQWLTTGRNSCPLCRGQGVDEKSNTSESSSSSPASTANADGDGASSIAAEPENVRS